MTLSAGQNLGHFEIIGLLGMGGMGEVYHARDLKLGREVAVKVLPERVAHDQNLLQRFEREARALAALNHPHIAALYSVEFEGAAPFLVMELVGGATLQDRLRSGGLPVGEALPLFAQIAEALDAAHDRGIIHRDLKPANVKITDDDRVKVLDFGLAKAFETGNETSPAGGTVALEPESGLTAEGAIVGTIIYMSPEQARGRPVDKRTDIWSFGCMLYEALTGKPPFRGETASDTIAHILEREPDWNSLPQDTPARVRELLWRCLQKDPKRRLRDIGEAWFGIREHESSSSSAPFAAPPTAERKSNPLYLGILLILAIAVGAGGSALLITRTDSAPGQDGMTGSAASLESSRQVRRFSIDLTGSFANSSVIPFFALSPDGSKLAYFVNEPGREGLLLRPFDRFETRFFSGTEHGYAPFFSPDGDWIGMMRIQGGLLQVLKVPADGGQVAQIASSESGPQSGQDWGEGDLIVINPKVRSPLYSVRASGGQLEPLLELDADHGERMQLYPQVLPGGKAVMFTSVGTNAEGKTFGGIDVYLPQTGERKRVLEGAAFGRYVASGHLLYVPYVSDVAPRYVAAAAFDLDALEVVGKTGTPVLNNVYIHPISYLAQFNVANEGTLAYLQDITQQTEIVSVDRKGNAQSLGLPPRDYRTPRLSPDGRRIAVAIKEGPLQDVWLYDQERTSLSRLTLLASAHSPLWRPDGQSLIVSAARDRFVNLFAVDAGGSGDPDLLTRNEAFECPTSFSDDGSIMTWSMLDLRQSSYNVAVGTPNMESLPIPYFNSRFWEMWPAISPDGARVTFVSNRTGKAEVYIAPYPGPGPITQVSIQGGTEPLWSPQGDELFYRQGNAMMAVAVDLGSPPEFGVPVKLFEGRYLTAGGGFAQEYDVTPDGRFLMTRLLETPVDSNSQTQRINIVMNWFEELNQLVPPVPSGN